MAEKTAKERQLQFNVAPLRLQNPASVDEDDSDSTRCGVGSQREGHKNLHNHRKKFADTFGGTLEVDPGPQQTVKTSDVSEEELYSQRAVLQWFRDCAWKVRRGGKSSKNRIFGLSPPTPTLLLFGSLFPTYRWRPRSPDQLEPPIGCFQCCPSFARHTLTRRSWPTLAKLTLAKPTLAIFFSNGRNQSNGAKLKTKQRLPVTHSNPRSGPRSPPPGWWGPPHQSSQTQVQHLSVPALQTPPKFHEKTPQREKKKMKFPVGESKKSAKFWASHPSGPPTLRAPLFLGPGPHPLRAPHPFRPPPKTKLAKCGLASRTPWSLLTIGRSPRQPRQPNELGPEVPPILCSLPPSSCHLQNSSINMGCVTSRGVTMQRRHQRGVCSQLHASKLRQPVGNHFKPPAVNDVGRPEIYIGPRDWLSLWPLLLCRCALPLSTENPPPSQDPRSRTRSAMVA